MALPLQGGQLILCWSWTTCITGSTADTLAAAVVCVHVGASLTRPAVGTQLMGAVALHNAPWRAGTHSAPAAGDGNTHSFKSVSCALLLHGIIWGFLRFQESHSIAHVGLQGWEY